MKKFIALLLTAVTIFCLVSVFSACNSNNNSNESIESTYNSLNAAFLKTSSAMGDIYKSWYFTVYESGKYNSSGYYYGYIDTAYANYIGRDYGDVADAFKSLYNKSCTSTWFKVAISDVSTGIPLIIKILTNEGVYTAIDTEMENAKECIKNINKDNACYEDLMAYYTEMLSYYEFVKSPSGSFSSLESTVNSYEKSIQGYKNKLSSYID